MNKKIYIMCISILLLIIPLLLISSQSMERANFKISDNICYQNNRKSLIYDYNSKILNYIDMIDKNQDTTKPIFIALLGTDERKNEISRSDVIMVIRYDHVNKKAVIVSIPRDSRVEIPGRGLDKINAAYAYGGYELQLKTIENLLDLKINNYVHINLNGFIEIVDKLGGVRVNSHKDFIINNKQNDYIIKKGDNVLNGEQALYYVRFRSDKDGDFGRIKRQQEVLLSISKELLTPDKLNQLPSIIKIIKGNVETDISWPKITKLTFDIKDINSIDIEFHTLETYSQKINKIWYEIIDEQRLYELSNKLNQTSN